MAGAVRGVAGGAGVHKGEGACEVIDSGVGFVILDENHAGGLCPRVLRAESFQAAPEDRRPCLSPGFPPDLRATRGCLVNAESAEEQRAQRKQMQEFLPLPFSALFAPLRSLR